ncbi:MAG: hypothetical protein IPL16_07400 [Ignavibacteria bacterium]|nr:hypothetical protein [Ignavibacteria bacterium]
MGDGYSDLIIGASLNVDAAGRAQSGKSAHIGGAIINSGGQVDVVLTGLWQQVISLEYQYQHQEMNGDGYELGWG